MTAKIDIENSYVAERHGQKMKIVMYPHSGCYNHGCEAIIRSTAAMLGMKKQDLYLYTNEAENDYQFGLDKICTILPNVSADVKMNTLHKKIFAVKEKVLGKNRDNEEICFHHKALLNTAKNAVALSVGGDNYCYTGMQHCLSEYSKMFEYKNIPMVLWGCSLEQKLISPKVAHELGQYQIITARESLTMELLYDMKLGENAICCSDPAFTLERQETNYQQDFFSKENVIGINISALIKSYDAYPNATVRNFRNLIEYILENTSSSIIFIPHVRAKNNDDLVTIKKLASEFNSKRMLIVDEDYNCMQLKDIIARCRMFIGCRTHATIAAYSTCVPTLVVGYSTKARGICKDLFGENPALLVDAREFSDDFDLTRKFQAFAEQEKELKTHLETIMPEYIQRAYKAKDAVEKMLQNRL